MVETKAERTGADGCQQLFATERPECDRTETNDGAGVAQTRVFAESRFKRFQPLDELRLEPARRDLGIVDVELDWRHGDYWDRRRWSDSRRRPRQFLLTESLRRATERCTAVTVCRGCRQR